MSAKWRRTKRPSKRFNIFRALDRVKDMDNVQALPIKAPRLGRQKYPYRHWSSKKSIERKMREPEPLIDVIEEKNEIIVVADFAGFKRENLKLRIKNQRLTLSAKALNRKYHKSLNLPKRVIPSNLRTRFKNGVLEIRLKKALEEKTIDKLAG